MLDKLQKLVQRYIGDEEIVITSDMMLLTDLGLNSFELIQLVNDIEEIFSIKIPDKSLGDLKTVQNVLDYIAAYARE